MPLSGAQLEDGRSFTDEEVDLGVRIRDSLVRGDKEQEVVLAEAIDVGRRESQPISEKHVRHIFELVVENVRAKIAKASGVHNGKPNGKGVAH